MARVIEAPVPSSALLQQMMAAGVEEREDLLVQFIRVHERPYQNVARSLIHSYGLVGRVDLPDVVQIVNMVAWQMLDRHFSGEEPLPVVIDSWPALVKSRCRNEMEEFSSTHADRTLSMSRSKRRRLARYSAYRTRLVSSLGRDPSPQEVIELANRELERRASPEKSSNMILSLADSSWEEARVHPVRPEFGDDVADERPGSAVDGSSDEGEGDRWFLLAPGEAPKFLERVYDRLRKRHSVEAGRVAKALLAPAIKEANTEEDVERGRTMIPSMDQVAESEGVPVEFVREVRALMMESAMSLLLQDARRDPEFRERLVEFAEQEGIDFVA